MRHLKAKVRSGTFQGEMESIPRATSQLEYESGKQEAK